MEKGMKIATASFQHKTMDMDNTKYRKVRNEPHFTQLKDEGTDNQAVFLWKIAGKWQTDRYRYIWDSLEKYSEKQYKHWQPGTNEKEIMVL